MTDRGLFPAPDEEPPVSVSQTAASLPRADAPEVELLPCPFCGQSAIFLDNTRGKWWVACDNGKCDVNPETTLFETYAEAATEWNRRDGEDARIAEAKAQGAVEEQKRILKASSAASQRREDGMRYILIPVLFEVVLKSEE